MKVPWLTQRERGSVFALRLMVWCTLGLGRRISRLMLPPICLYFTVFSIRARSASRGYLNRILGRPARLRDTLRHYHVFASTIHDRIYFLCGRYEYFDVRLNGLEVLDAQLSRGRGCILLGSHLGSFEVLRSRSAFEGRAPINVLMHERNADKINRVLNTLNPDIARRVIPLGTPMTLLRAKECLKRGEMVGILGDRAIRGERAQSCNFLGACALLPEGPLLLASILGVPVLLFFGLYRGGHRYDIHIEAFATNLELSRTNRSKELSPWLARYAARLEHYCREAPYNWFNFYDFWQRNEH